MGKRSQGEGGGRFDEIEGATQRSKRNETLVSTRIHYARALALARARADASRVRLGVGIRKRELPHQVSLGGGGTRSGKAGGLGLLGLAHDGLARDHKRQ